MYSIVIVDDEDNIRNAIISSVDWAELGFEIVGEASNGIEALEVIEKCEPDLLVSDIKMPFMSGIELARQAREIRPNMQIVFITGYEQFEYAKQAIKYNILEYLLKPLSPEDIKIEFSNIKKKLDEKFGEILDIDSNVDYKRENVELKKLNFLTSLIMNNKSALVKPATYSSIGIKFDVNAKISKRKYLFFVTKTIEDVSTDEDAILLKRTYNVVKIISEKYFECECFVYDGKVCVLISDFESNLNKYMKILSKDIVLTAKRIMSLAAYVGVSNHFEELQDTHTAYHEALNAISYIDKTDEHIIHIDDMEEPRLTYTDIEETVRELEEKLKVEKESEIETQIDEIFRKLNDNKMSKSDFNLCVLEIIFMNYRALRLINDDIPLNSTLINQLVFNKTTSEVEAELKELCLDVSRAINNQRQKNIDVLADKAMQIIRSSYANKDMSLFMLSETLHCSPNYLSSLIKKIKGDSFVNLLTKERMMRAKEQLLSSNKKIMEIAEDVGYGDQHYFSYCFKKYYDVSPNKMRESTRQ